MSLCFQLRAPASSSNVNHSVQPRPLPARTASSPRVLDAVRSAARAVVAARDAAFDALLEQIGTALEADPTLGDLVFGLTYGRPEPAIEAIAGAPAITSATLSVTVDYETDAPLA